MVASTATTVSSASTSMAAAAAVAPCAGGRTTRPPHAPRRAMAAMAVVVLLMLPCALGFLLPGASPSTTAVSSAARAGGGGGGAAAGPAATTTTALFVKREGRRGPGYKGGSGGGGGGSGGGGYRGRRGGRRGDAGAEPSKDPSKRLANLNRKLSSIIELEQLPWDELNEEQRQKVERKEEIQAEISRLTKLVRQQDFIEEAAEKRESAESAEDLNQDVVGGRIPRTLLKLLTYCRVSDKATCEVLLELGKVKVNGEVCDDPVKLVDLVKDKIEFEGELVTLPETRLKHKLRSLESQSSDFDDGVPKDYCARIDGGLLIDLTRNIEKARGDFIDKSPYIMRDRNGGRGGGGRG